MVGAGPLTVGMLADRLEEALAALTQPGYRVYRPSRNRDRFWSTLIEEE